VISQYKFEISNLNKTPQDYSFEEYLKDQKNKNRDNLITRHFCGLLNESNFITSKEKNIALKNLSYFQNINTFDNWEIFTSDLLSNFGLPSVFYSKFQNKNYIFEFKPKQKDLDLIQKYYQYDFHIYDEIKKHSLKVQPLSKTEFNKNICIVSPFIKSENKLFTEDQIKKLISINKKK
jgi:hypothetical protein